MTKPHCIELDFSWRDWESLEYLRALSLPTLSWATPFLPLLGLPNVLLEQRSVWESIYTQAEGEHETRYRARDWTGSPDGERGELISQVVIKALQQLAFELGRDVASELEQWVRFHFLCPEARTAMREWGRALRYAYVSPDSKLGHKKVPPPIALIPLLPEIRELVDLERRDEIEDNLRRVAPLPPYVQTEYEYLEHCYEALLLSKALNQAITLKALQTIAQNLNEEEREQVATWAQIQTQTMSRYAKPEYLGARYLHPSLPCFDIPSVLDLPLSDASS